MCIRDSFDENIQASVDDPFVQFEIRDAVTQQTANFIILFENGHGMTCLVHKISDRKSGRSRANNGNFFTCPFLRDIGVNQVQVESMFDHGTLVLPDGNRLIMNGQHTGFFTRRRTYSSCKFREAVGFVQDIVSIIPVSTVNSIPPFRDVASYRTGPVAKRYAAIHAPRRLAYPILVVQCLFNFAKITYPFTNWTISAHFSFYFYKTLWISHVTFNYSCYKKLI